MPEGTTCWQSQLFFYTQRGATCFLWAPTHTNLRGFIIMRSISLFDFERKRRRASVCLCFCNIAFLGQRHIAPLNILGKENLTKLKHMQNIFANVEVKLSKLDNLHPNMTAERYKRRGFIPSCVDIVL